MRSIAVILDGPIDRRAESAVLAGAADGAGDLGRVGACLRFEGIVRLMEPRSAMPGLAPAQPGQLLALHYETYDPMAQRELDSLAADVAQKHDLVSILALHSRGRVAVGETSFVLEVRSGHRAQSLAAVSEFIDRMKQGVPIWKLPVFRDATSR